MNTSLGNGSKEDLDSGRMLVESPENLGKQFYEEYHFLFCRSQSISHLTGKGFALEGITGWLVGMRIL